MCTPESDNGIVGKGLLRRERAFEGQPIRVHVHYSAQYSRSAKSEGLHVQLSSYNLYAITYLVGTTLKGLSILRSGNAMCENYEVSEVSGISRRRNSHRCPPGTLEQSGLQFPFLSRCTQVPRPTQTRGGVGSQER